MTPEEPHLPQAAATLPIFGKDLIGDPKQAIGGRDCAVQKRHKVSRRGGADRISNRAGSGIENAGLIYRPAQFCNYIACCGNDSALHRFRLQNINVERGLFRIH